MIDKNVKTKLINELEKSGNIYYACAKLNISRANYYRWIKKDKNFKKSANEALQLGRETICDIAEHALMIKVKEKDMGAIKYTLSHNSSLYSSKRPTKFILEHISSVKKEDEAPPITLEDLIKADDEKAEEKMRDNED